MVSIRGLATLGLAGLAVGYSSGGIVVNEIVVDPQQDWNNSGSITGSDEWFEIYNTDSIGSDPFNLYGLELHLIDTTPSALSLTNFGSLEAGHYLMILNPEGEQNNNGRIEIYDVVNNRVLDGFSYGNWEGNLTGIPDGNAHGLYDESLSRFPNGSDVFVKAPATFGRKNIPSSGSLLALTGMGAIASSRRMRR